jgi:hypothetical protein
MIGMTTKYSFLAEENTSKVRLKKRMVRWALSSFELTKRNQCENDPNYLMSNRYLPANFCSNSVSINMISAVMVLNLKIPIPPGGCHYQFNLLFRYETAYDVSIR